MYQTETNEEEFLRNVDEEMDCQSNSSIEESLDEVSYTHHEVIDEITDQIDTSEEQSDILAKSAEKQAKRITDTMEKVCVAPGEFGQFQNWKNMSF